VSLHAAAGEVLAFLGPNGAGKTTTIKMIAGLIEPDDGTVRIDGKDPARDPSALHAVGAVLEGNRNVYWRLTPAENLEYFGMLRGLSRAETRRRIGPLLERFDLTDKRDAVAQNLSRGMQQKLSIAVAFIHQPRLLLLDEPTLGLDVEAAESVKTLVREIAADGHAILLTTHQLDVAEELSDRVAIIRRGEIIAEEPARELIRRFSGQAYTLEYDGELSPAQLEALRDMPIEIRDGHLDYLGTPEGLWQVLEILKPLPLRRLAPEEADLTGVFLKLIREAPHD
jgi:ABC-2 type transport system ATP-binding protein